MLYTKSYAWISFFKVFFPSFFQPLPCQTCLVPLPAARIPPSRNGAAPALRLLPKTGASGWATLTRRTRTRRCVWGKPRRSRSVTFCRRVQVGINEPLDRNHKLYECLEKIHFESKNFDRKWFRGLVMRPVVKALSQKFPKKCLAAQLDTQKCLFNRLLWMFWNHQWKKGEKDVKKFFASFNIQENCLSSIYN